MKEYYHIFVMKIVHHFAGLALDESDVLRRIMTGKKKSSDTFKRLREKYFENCIGDWPRVFDACHDGLSRFTLR